jgi:hypothetical protein
MSLSESCSCGASFSAERDDELRLLNHWRKSHVCPKPERGSLALGAVVESAPVFTEPELHIGFRSDPFDD